MVNCVYTWMQGPAMRQRTDDDDYHFTKSKIHTQYMGS